MLIPLDDLDHAILAALQADARTAPAVLAERLAGDAQDIAARIARMEEAGVITGYHARIHPAAAGLAVTAFVRISARGYVTPLEVVAAQVPGIVECHAVTGEDDGLVKVVARDVAALEAILFELARCGATTTSLVLSSPAPWKPLPRA